MRDDDGSRRQAVNKRGSTIRHNKRRQCFCGHSASVLNVLLNLDVWNVLIQSWDNQLVIKLHLVRACFVDPFVRAIEET